MAVREMIPSRQNPARELHALTSKVTGRFLLSAISCTRLISDFMASADIAGQCCVHQLRNTGSSLNLIFFLLTKSCGRKLGLTNYHLLRCLSYNWGTMNSLFPLSSIMVCWYCPLCPTHVSIISIVDHDTAKVVPYILGAPHIWGGPYLWISPHIVGTLIERL